ACLAIAIVVVLMRSEPEPLVEVKVALPPQQQPIVNPNPAPILRPQPKPIKPVVQPLQPDVKKPDAPNVNPVAPPEVQKLDRACDWLVKVDPGPKWADEGYKVKAPTLLQGLSKVVFPSTASEFVAMHSGGGDKHKWATVHVPTMKTRGVIEGKINLE